MKGIVVEAARNLHWTEVETPEPGPGEVRVQVHATAINRADLLQRRGLYPPPAGASSIMGLEVAGIVERLGEGVGSTHLGERVAALLPGGGYAQYVVVPEKMLLPVPDSLSLTEAAAIPEVFYTAYLNLFLEGECREGETVLVHAAASGVGTAAVQLCKAFGTTVLGTASQAKLSFLDELGIDLAIDRDNEDFAARVDEFTDHEGVDLILDPVGGNYFPKNLHLLRERGRLVIIGLLSGAEADISLGRLLRKRLKVIGSVLRSRSTEEKIAITSRFLRDVWPLFSDNRLHAVVDEVLPITDVARGHQLLEENKTIGKVILVVDESIGC